MADKRTAEEIEHDLEVTRARLTQNISQLVTEVHPKAVVHRSVIEAKKTISHEVDNGKKLVRDTVEKAKKVFRDDSGWKWKHIAIAGAAVLLVTVAIAAKKK